MNVFSDSKLTKNTISSHFQHQTPKDKQLSSFPRPASHPLGIDKLPLTHSTIERSGCLPFRKFSLYSHCSHGSLHIHHAPATPNESSTTLPSLYAEAQPPGAPPAAGPNVPPVRGGQCTLLPKSGLHQDP